jgi:hypothetical protein
MATELPETLAWPVLRFNTLVLGSTRPLTTAAIEARSRTLPHDLLPLRPLLLRELHPLAAARTPWTDDRAPVEWVTDRMIVEFAAEGGRFEGESLPTRPK